LQNCVEHRIDCHEAISRKRSGSGYIIHCCNAPSEGLREEKGKQEEQRMRERLREREKERECAKACVMDRRKQRTGKTMSNGLVLGIANLRNPWTSTEQLKLLRIPISRFLVLVFWRGRVQADV
jgi:hypothetical protein